MPSTVLDPETHPHRHYRIDAFAVPAEARAEFEEAMHRNLTFIQTLPGFVGHVVFEKTSGPTTFDIVTIATWESPEAAAAAGERVRAYYTHLGFDMPAALAKWGVTASIGNYGTPLRLQ